MIIPGQRVYATETLADSEGLSDLDLTGFPSQEFVGVWKLVMRADTGGGATGRAQIRKVNRLIGARSASSVGGTSPTVHNSLSGRASADTHPASSITNTPAGNIAATTVQAAINELDSEKVAANAAITGSTKTKITYDSKGLVTAGADATAAEITNTPVAPITSTNVQGALNEVASLANSASSAASSAQSTANSAASAAAYADRLARSSYNLIKNGNSEDANPTGPEAVWVSEGYAYQGTKKRSVTGVAYWVFAAVTGFIPCSEGDQFVFEAMTACAKAAKVLGEPVPQLKMPDFSGWSRKKRLTFATSPT